MIVGNKVEPRILYLTLNREKIKIVNSINNLGSSFSGDGGVKEVAGVGVWDRMRMFGATKRMCNYMSVTAIVKSELYESILVRV